MYERKNESDILAAVKAAVDPVMTAFEEFKKTNDERLAQIEKKGGADPLTVNKLDKIEKDLAKYEDLNQKFQDLRNSIDASTKQAETNSKLLDELRVKMNRPFVGADEAKAERRLYHKAWAHGVVNAFTKGVPNLDEEQAKAIARAQEEMKALSIANDTTGGYLAPAEMVLDIIKGVTLISPVRSLVRVVQTANKSRMQPKRTGQFAAQWVSEQGTRSETTGLTWGMTDIPTHEMYALIDISHQNLEDSAFDLAAEIEGEANEQFAVAEGAAIVNGSGVGKPEGWMTNADVTSANSGAAATIADVDGGGNGLLTAKHTIKTAYARNATWALNRTTIGSVRKLKDAQKQYIWMPGLANGAPNTIDGDPYVEVPDMPSEAANAYPIAYGDFARAYTMVDRISMQMLRDPYTQATAGNIRFLFYRRIGGQVVLPEAIIKVKCSV